MPVFVGKLRLIVLISHDFGSLHGENIRLASTSVIYLGLFRIWTSLYKVPTNLYSMKGIHIFNMYQAAHITIISAFWLFEKQSKFVISLILVLECLWCFVYHICVCCFLRNDLIQLQIHPLEGIINVKSFWKNLFNLVFLVETYHNSRKMSPFHITQIKPYVLLKSYAACQSKATMSQLINQSYGLLKRFPTPNPECRNHSD